MEKLKQNQPKRNSSLTRQRIIEAATRIFAAKSFSGARVDEIVREADVSKNLIYHYFENKEDLFIKVLEHNYSSLRAHQNELKIKDMDPEEGMKTLISLTFWYFVDHLELINLMNSENLHKARHLKKSEKILSMYNPLIGTLKILLDKGVAKGVFRDGIDPINLYISISGLGYFYLSNRYTLSTVLDINLFHPTKIKQRHDHIIDVIMQYVKT